MRPIDPRELKKGLDTEKSRDGGYQIRPGGSVRASVLAVQLSRPRPRKARLYAPRHEGLYAACSARPPENRLAEAVGLARAISLDVCHQGLVTITNIRPATLFGRGKIEEIKAIVRTSDVELVVVDHALTPVQQRNLEKAWSVKVLDRTGLILEIFGQRARTREGRLQVELAHLSYQRSRLVRSWIHLERQRGGYGFLGGPGETQIEADRRVIQTCIQAIRRELETVKRRRGLHRSGRNRVPYPIVALVGYTNAGKSTLFNALTGAGVQAEDLLFATLDPTMREIRLTGGTKAILSDTVGFISELPTPLIAAFRATLEEVVEADLILHVRDIAHEDSAAQMSDVNHVLQQLGIDWQNADTHILEVWNKIDQLGPQRREEIRNRAQRAEKRVVLTSAVSGEGLEDVLAAIDDQVHAASVIVDCVLQPSDGKTLSWIHDNCQILSQQSDDAGRISCRVLAPAVKHEQLQRLLKVKERDAAAR